MCVCVYVCFGMIFRIASGGKSEIIYLYIDILMLTLVSLKLFSNRAILLSSVVIFSSFSVIDFLSRSVSLASEKQRRGLFSF